MVTSFLLLIVTLPVSGNECPKPQASFLPNAETSSCIGDVPYIPQEGDLIFFASSGPKNLLYAIARTGTPHHVGIVVRSSTGDLGLFEAGVAQAKKVNFFCINERITNHLRDRKGAEIHVRSLQRPLSKEQSHSLTIFAERQMGKEFATIRVGLSGLGPRCNGPLARSILTTSNPERSTWFCSELTVEAMVAAGIIAHDCARSAIIYPRDMFRDQKLDLSDIYGPPLPLLAK